MYTATFRNIHCNIGRDLLQQQKKANATSQTLLLQHRENLLQQQNNIATSQALLVH
jgi:hypothetical protein